MILPLSQFYPSRYGAPVLHRVDPRIFTLTYFGLCMDCSFCHDACCQFGADVEWPRLEALQARSDDLEKYLGVPQSQWFRDKPNDFGILEEPEYPGGKYTRTKVVPLPKARAPFSEEGCVFLDPTGRGCRIHRYALDRGLNVYDLKPMMCSLFPLSFAEGNLLPADEFDEELLVCSGPGQTLFRAAFSDLEYYFGADLVAELAQFEREIIAAPERFGPARVGAVPLAVLP